MGPNHSTNDLNAAQSKVEVLAKQLREAISFGQAQEGRSTTLLGLIGVFGFCVNINLASYCLYGSKLSTVKLHAMHHFITFFSPFVPPLAMLA